MTVEYGEFRYGYNKYGGGERFMSIENFNDRWENRGIRHIGSTDAEPNDPIEWGYGFKYGEDYG